MGNILENVPFIGTKSAETLLEEASKMPQEKRNKVIRKNLDKIQPFLDSQDEVPTRTQVLKRNQARIDAFSKFVHEGVKPEVKMGWCEVSHDYPLATILMVMQERAEQIITELKERDIEAKELVKSSSWDSTPREKGDWTFDEIRQLPFDWVVSAIVRYHGEGEKKKCDRESLVITASEMRECANIVKAGSIEAHFAQQSDDTDSDADED